jgi:hypothetical protein
MALAAVWLPLGAPPAEARAVEPLTVTITDIGPATLERGSTLRVSGTVTNTDRVSWRSLQAYLTVPHAPFNTRDAMAQATSGDSGYTGERIVDAATIDDLGDLSPGKSTAFRIQVPWKKLGFTGATGVYPVGIQILATAPDDSRSTKAVGRATTFVPLVPAHLATAPTTLIWPFLLPAQRGASANYRDSFVASLAPGGQLRNLLALAESAPRNGSTLLLDPALIDAATSISAGRYTRATREQQHQAAAFVAALKKFAGSGSTWLLGYGNPDDLALSSARGGERLRTVIDTATTGAAGASRVHGTRVAWFTPGTASGPALATTDRRPAIVAAADATGWRDALGSVATDTATGGPLVLIDDLTAHVPGAASSATLRQAVLADAAFAALSRQSAPNSAADAVVMVPPTWDPGPDAPSLAAVFRPTFIVARSLDSRLGDHLPKVSGRFAETQAAPVGRAVIATAEDFLTESARALELTDHNPRLTQRLAAEAALMTSVSWRGHSQAAVAAARARVDELTAELDHLVIEGPPSFTLSGSQGRFPLTISNATNFPVRVGVQLDSSNPALTIPDVRPVVIKAHERRTLTVTIDVGRQKSATVISTLVSASGRHVGAPFEFNLRSSNVDAVIWLAMGAAGLFVFVALGRRATRQRRGTP